MALDRVYHDSVCFCTIDCLLTLISDYEKALQKDSGEHLLEDIRLNI